MPFRILFAVLCFWPIWSCAESLPEARGAHLDASVTELPLTPLAEIIKDRRLSMTADQVLSTQAEVSNAGSKAFVSFGFSKAAYWFRIPLHNKEAATLDYLLVFKPTWLDDIQVTLSQDGRTLQEYHGGDTLPFSQRSVGNPQPNFALHVPPGQSQLLVRVQSRDPVDVGMTLFQHATFYASEASEARFWGITYGVLGALLLYNLFLFFSVREKIYVAYAVYLLSFLVMHATLNGHAYQALWPDLPAFNNWILAALVYLYMFAGLAFAILFLELRTRLSKAYRWTRNFALLLLSTYLLTALWGYGPNIFSATAWVIFYGPFVMLLAIWSLRSGNRAARFFLLGTISGLIGSCITPLTTSGILPFSFLTYHAVDFGMVVDAILLSLALADRISLMRQEKDKARAEIEQQDERWRLAIESAGEGVWDWRVPSGDVLYSRRWKGMLGYEEQEIANNVEAWRKLVHPFDLPGASEGIAACFAGKATAYRSEFRMLCKDGSWKWILAQGAVVERDAVGNPVRMIGTHIDISEPKRLEATIKEMNEHLEERVAQRTRELEVARVVAEQANQSKTRFLAAAGHDLRQPLAAANLFIDALRYTKPTAEQDHLLQRMEQSMTMFNELLESLLNISKLDAGAIKPQYTTFSIGVLFHWIAENFESLAHQQQIGFKLHYARQKNHLVCSDLGLVKSVVQNLVTNALKFTPSGAIMVSARRRGDAILIQVWDTGVGIAEENLPRIFDEFYQVGNSQRDRSNGLGLGLSIAKRSISLLGGELNCRSRVGHGSVFCFRLPLDEQASSTQAVANDARHTQEIAQSAFVRGKRFVVIENEMLVAEALSQVISTMGGKTTVFSDAESALNAPSMLEADYYIVDYMLAGELNGMQFLERLQKQRALPVCGVLITGDTSPEFVYKSGDFAWPVLHKPVNISMLIEKLLAQPKLAS
ncbi:7TM diverse intracellular signaling domain-containing protein [Sideroxyarcus sp. TK5]